MAHGLAVAGEAGEARALLEELRQSEGRRYVPPYGLALVHTGLGEKEEALRYLWKAFELREPNLLWLGVHPRFDPLRSDAGFEELLRRVGAPGDEKH